MPKKAMPGRFWSFVRRGNSDECWPWIGGRHFNGYGKFKVDGKFWRAHRLAYTLANGNIPHGLFVCHTCDNPPCCNPGHLWVGSGLDNIRDAWRKGRCENIRRAAKITIERIGRRAKLTEAQVLEIRGSDENNLVIATRLWLNDGTISQLRLGKTWAHVGGRIRASDRARWTRRGSRASA